MSQRLSMSHRQQPEETGGSHRSTSVYAGLPTQKSWRSALSRKSEPLESSTSVYAGLPTQKSWRSALSRKSEPLGRLRARQTEITQRRQSLEPTSASDQSWEAEAVRHTQASIQRMHAQLDEHDRDAHHLRGHRSERPAEVGPTSDDVQASELSDQDYEFQPSNSSRAGAAEKPREGAARRGEVRDGTYAGYNYRTSAAANATPATFSQASEKRRSVTQVDTPEDNSEPDEEVSKLQADVAETPSSLRDRPRWSSEKEGSDHVSDAGDTEGPPFSSGFRGGARGGRRPLSQTEPRRRRSEVDVPSPQPETRRQRFEAYARAQGSLRGGGDREDAPAGESFPDYNTWERRQSHTQPTGQSRARSRRSDAPG